MHPRPQRGLLLAAVLGLILGHPGCSRQTPGQQADALAASIVSTGEKLAALGSQADADDIADNAQEATRNFRRLERLRSDNPADSQITSSHTRADAAMREIRRLHREARDRKRHDTLARSLKFRTYRAGRELVVPKLLRVLAVAARKAGETDPESVPESIRSTLEAAVGLVGFVDAPSTESLAMIAGKDQPPPPAYWLQMATQLDAWCESEPPALSLVLGTAFAATGQDALALAEIERIDMESIPAGDELRMARAVRALVYARLGLFTQARAEVDEGEEGDADATLAGIHLVFAYLHFEDREWMAVDRELAHAIQAWPDNPAVIYLTGERLLADGHKEAALDSLARASAGTRDAKIAAAIEKRIREVRDSDEADPTLVLDLAFLVELCVHGLEARASDSNTARRAAQCIEAARRAIPLLGTPDASSTPGPE